MKKSIIVLFAFLSTAVLAQTEKNCCEEKAYIDVTGSAEMEIIPDEIYITVVLREMYDGKTKVTIEKLESDMFSALKNIGIDPANISLSDASSNYYYRWLKEDDALLSRSYTVLVNSADLVIRVYDAMGKMKASNAYISKLSHSKIEEFRMQTKVNATVAAKTKAGNMLTAIGEKIGGTLMVIELEENIYSPFEVAQLSNVMIESGSYDSDSYNSSDISYQKIILRYEVSARFQIL